MGWAVRETAVAVNWFARAACAGEPDWWFVPAKYADAIEICETCPVRQECLEDALTLQISDDHGIRGGLTPEQRRGLR